MIELQLHNKSAAVIFLQYQFSLLEGTIILPVSLIFHSYNTVPPTCTRDVYLEVLLRKSELFVTPEYSCDPEATRLSGFPPDKMGKEGQLDPALPAWLGSRKTLFPPHAARPTQPATEVCQQSTSNSRTVWFCISRQYLLICC